MELATRRIVVLGAILLCSAGVRMIDPTILGTWGGRIQGGVVALMIVQWVDRVFVRQQLRRQERADACG
ncbi:MAG: hypothetical protein Q7R22_009970 [Verrucomicrobiota bacterium JB025]|nr:hypothetical protein [Verrucomicrobiota bacterium JB025]